MPGISNANNFPSGKSLNERVCLITGGSGGIGKAIALRLAALGASVCICGRDEKKLKRAEIELRSTDAKALALRADVNCEKDILSLVQTAERQLGPISVLVNNAGTGVGGFGAIQDKTEAEWDHIMNTNLKSIFFASRAVVPGMMQRREGDIVNISSLAGKNTFAGGGLYCASKWAVQGLSGCMAEDLRAYGIRVTTICPGSVATDFVGRGPKDPTKVLRAEDVAHAVVMVVTQGPQSFLSEIQLRPLAKP